jgi:DNA-binding MarR family transcriptional regulator
MPSQAAPRPRVRSADTSSATIAADVAELFPAMYRRFRATSQLLPGSDITPRMLALLHHLAASGPLTLSELVVHMRMGKATATELVNRVEERGLVERMRDERDHRRVFVCLTDAGRRRAQQHPRVLEDSLLEVAVRRMRPADREALVRGMRALVATPEREEPQ